MLQGNFFHWWSSRLIRLGVYFCSWMLLVNLIACAADRSGGAGAGTASTSRLLQVAPAAALQGTTNVTEYSTALTTSFAAISPSPETGMIDDGQTCPLNFTALDKFPYIAQQAADEALDNATRCLALHDGLAVVMSEYLKNTNFFLVPAETAPACLQAYDAQLAKQGFMTSATTLSSMCGISVSDISRGTDHCEHIQTLDDFKRLITFSVSAAINNSCSGVLGSGNSRSTLCPACISQMLMMATALGQQANGSSISSTSAGCYNYTVLYVGAFVQPGGPLDPTAVVCLWNILPDQVQGMRSSKVLHVIIGATAVVVVSMGAAVILFLHYRQREIAKQIAYVKQTTQMVECSSVSADFAMVWYSLDEMKAATHNFATDTIAGSGAFANVYRGVLEDGTEIAVKRFKNCSPNGDADFIREVEALSNARHKNLVTLRGCCIASSSSSTSQYVMGVPENIHQRIIVCDFMRNGSLHDFLFRSPTTAASSEQLLEQLSASSSNTKILDWPTRKKIAIDMARGIDYLHYRAQPQILHRDIKSSNILLDSDFNARVSDFGLAKFTPDGITHLTTRAAGTFGYIAPEYALYGQLTERSDVYSFGVVLLELISGRKALLAGPLAATPTTTMTTTRKPTTTATTTQAADKNSGFTLITDWANSLLKSGNWIEVLDPRMMMMMNKSNNPNMSDDEASSINYLGDMERFVTVALLCAHPQIAYRPTITQALRVLENAQHEVPVLPDRPIPVTLERSRINDAVGGSSNLFSTSQGFQSFATVSSLGSSYMAR
jgi:serine/threonine protein kinase